MKLKSLAVLMVFLVQSQVSYAAGGGTSGGGGKNLLSCVQLVMNQFKTAYSSSYEDSMIAGFLSESCAIEIEQAECIVKTTFYGDQESQSLSGCESDKGI